MDTHLDMFLTNSEGKRNINSVKKDNNLNFLNVNNPDSS